MCAHKVWAPPTFAPCVHTQATMSEVAHHPVTSSMNSCASSASHDAARGDLTAIGIIGETVAIGHSLVPVPHSVQCVQPEVLYTLFTRERNWGTLSESERQPYIDESTRRRRAFIAWHQAQLGMVRDGVCTDASAAIAAGGARVCWLWATCAGCLRQFKIKTAPTALGSDRVLFCRVACRERSAGARLAGWLDENRTLTADTAVGPASLPTPCGDDSTCESADVLYPSERVDVTAPAFDVGSVVCVGPANQPLGVDARGSRLAVVVAEPYFCKRSKVFLRVRWLHIREERVTWEAISAGIRQCCSSHSGNLSGSIDIDRAPQACALHANLFTTRSGFPSRIPQRLVSVKLCFSGATLVPTDDVNSAARHGMHAPVPSGETTSGDNSFRQHLKPVIKAGRGTRTTKLRGPFLGIFPGTLPVQKTRQKIQSIVLDRARDEILHTEAMWARGDPVPPLLPADADILMSNDAIARAARSGADAFGLMHRATFAHHQNQRADASIATAGDAAWRSVASYKTVWNVLPPKIRKRGVMVASALSTLRGSKPPHPGDTTSTFVSAAAVQPHSIPPSMAMTSQRALGGASAAPFRTSPMATSSVSTTESTLPAAIAFSDRVEQTRARWHPTPTVTSTSAMPNSHSSVLSTSSQLLPLLSGPESSALELDERQTSVSGVDVDSNLVSSSSADAVASVVAKAMPSSLTTACVVAVTATEATPADGVVDASVCEANSVCDVNAAETTARESQPSATVALVSSAPASEPADRSTEASSQLQRPFIPDTSPDDAADAAAADNAPSEPSEPVKRKRGRPKGSGKKSAKLQASEHTSDSRDGEEATSSTSTRPATRTSRSATTAPADQLRHSSDAEHAQDESDTDGSRRKRSAPHEQHASDRKSKSPRPSTMQREAQNSDRKGKRPQRVASRAASAKRVTRSHTP